MEFCNFFPTFAWVLRDFALDLVDEDGAPMDPDQYLESALRAQPGFDENTLERNRIRQMLTAFFTDRKCFPLVRPLVDEERLQEIDQVPYEELREEFREGMEDLKDFLYLHHLKPKIVNGMALNGTSFIALTEQYISAISEGGVPTITSAWNEVMQKECEDATVAALKVYDNEIEAQAKKRVAALELNSLVDLHAKAMKLALASFASRAGGKEAVEYQGKLETTLLSKFNDLAANNFAKSEEQCSLAIKGLYKTLVEPKLENGMAGYLEATDGPYASLQSDLNMLSSNYRVSASATGPAKGAAIAALYDRDVLEAVRGISARLDEQNETKLAQISEKMKEVKVKLAGVEAREKVYNESIEKQREEAMVLTTKNMQLQQQNVATEKRVTQVLEELQQRTNRVSELEMELEETKEAFESEQHWQATLTEKCERLQKAHDEKHAAYTSLEQKHSSAHQTHEEQHNELRTKLGELDADYTRVQSQLNENLGLLKEKSADLTMKEQELSAIQREKLSLTSQLEEAKAKFEKATAVHEAVSAEGQERIAFLEAKLSEATELAAKERAEALAEAKRLSDELAESKAKVAEVTAGKDEAEKQAVGLHAQLDDTARRLKETETRSASQRKQAEKAMSDAKTQAQRKVAQLQTQLEKKKSDHSNAKAELTKMKAKESEMDLKAENDARLHESMLAEKDTQIFAIQRDLNNKTQAIKAKEVELEKLREKLEETESDVVSLEAMSKVVGDEKEKQQALFETTLSDHFAKHGDLQGEHDNVRAEFEAYKAQQEEAMTEAVTKMEEYKAIVQQVHTKKHGLLRKQTRKKRMFGQAWHVKHFTLVGATLLHKDVPKEGKPAGPEKAFQMTVDTTINQEHTEKFAFVVTTGDNELVLKALDQAEMDDWVKEITASLAAMQTSSSDERAQLAQLASLGSGAAEEDDE